jgi:L-2-amino-thiazoline-4-carboxylic acid hydrolase
MAIQDTFNGAKTGLTLLNAYSEAVAQAIGMEQATALLTMTCENLGAAQGRLMKEQAGIEEFDAKTAQLLLMKAIEEGFGIQSEVIEETPEKVVVKVGRCSDYESAQAVGMDAEAIEAACRACSIRFMEAMAKQLNPNLSYQLVKFRSAPEDNCEEAIVLA